MLGGEGLTLLQPARLAPLVGVVDQLPPPDELAVEASPAESVARGCGAPLDVRAARMARRGGGLRGHSAVTESCGRGRIRQHEAPDGSPAYLIRQVY
jgi:hypothetical protein